GLPANALQLYRGRADPGARKWLEEGLAGQDDLLRKVADEAFCSTPAARALDALGDRAFVRGDLDEALAWWGRLAPLGPVPQGGRRPGPPRPPRGRGGTRAGKAAAGAAVRRRARRGGAPGRLPGPPRQGRGHTGRPQRQVRRHPPGGRRAAPQGPPVSG